jgi:hypothetical protein
VVGSNWNECGGLHPEVIGILGPSKIPVTSASSKDERAYSDHLAQCLIYHYH